MEHFEDVNVGGNKWISLLETERGHIRDLEGIDIGVIQYFVTFGNETLSEFRKHIRRHSI